MADSSLSNATVFVYGLADPLNGELRYIGWTRNLKGRLKNHLVQATPTRCTNRAKVAWIESLREQGTKPEIFVIEEVPYAQRMEAEDFWIVYFRSLGCRLTNQTSYGDGYIISPKARRLNGDFHRGRPKPESMRRAMSAYQNGRKKSAAQVAKMAERESLEWIVTDPQGNTQRIRNLRAFCREHGLDTAAMHRVAKGINSYGRRCLQHKGWRCRHAD